MAKLELHPLTPKRWRDFVQLFGERGVGGCWCMWFRLPGSEFRRGAGVGAGRSGDANRRAMKAIVDQRRTPGLLAYEDGQPVGWCSVAPREEFGRIERSPVTRPIDDRPVWSVVCFYMDRKHRGAGVGTALLEAAVRHAVEHGAEAIEAYPEDPGGRRIPNPEAYTGLVSMFERAGFREVARRSAGRPIMRYEAAPARRGPRSS